MKNLYIFFKPIYELNPINQALKASVQTNSAGHLNMKFNAQSTHFENFPH